MSNTPRLLRVADVAALLSCSKISVYRGAESGRIPCFRVPAVGLRFDADELEAWLAEQRIGAGLRGVEGSGASSPRRPSSRPRLAGLSGENSGADG